MAGVTGLEPAASGVTGRRSNQLSYTPARVSDNGITQGARQCQGGFLNSVKKISISSC